MFYRQREEVVITIIVIAITMFIAIVITFVVAIVITIAITTVITIVITFVIKRVLDTSVKSPKEATCSKKHKYLQRVLRFSLGGMGRTKGERPRG